MHRHVYESEITTARLKLKSRFGHLGGDLAGSGDVVRGEHAVEVRDQRFPGGGRKVLGGADFEPFGLSCPDRLMGLFAVNRGSAGVTRLFA
jgi:hypothetical protein